MAFEPGVLVFVAYPKDDPLGTPLGTLTNAVRKSVTVEDNGIGQGSFAIHPDDTGASWCAQDNYVAVWRDSVAGDPIAGFWMDTFSEVVLSPDEGGGKLISVSGRGPIAILEEAVVWSVAKSGTSAVVFPDKDQWRWKNAHPARPLVRLLEEADHRGCFAGAVTWDFTRTLDTDGDPWSGEAFDEFSFAMGTDLLTVVRELRESGLHITMDASLALHAWDSFGTDLSSTIGFTAGVDIRDTSEIEAAARRGKSAVLVRGEKRGGEPRWRPVVNSNIETLLGRRKEGSFRYDRTATNALLKQVGQRKLQRWKKQHDGPFTAGVLDTTGQVALVDYFPGDTVGVPAALIAAEKERIAAITLTERDDNGEYDVTLEFGDLAPDPVTGNTPSGDVEGAGCCGDTGGVGKGPGGGGGGGSGSGSPAPGVPAQPYTLDDFEREVVTAETESSGTTHSIALPDGCDVVGRTILLFIESNDAGDGEVAADLEALGFSFIDDPAGSPTDGEWGGFHNTYVMAKVIDVDDSFPATGGTITVTTTASDTLQAVAVLLNGAGEIEAEQSDSGTAPAINPSWDTALPMRVYRFCVSTDTITGTPAGYTNIASGSGDYTGHPGDGWPTRYFSLDYKDNADSNDEAWGTYVSTGALQTWTVAVVRSGWGSIPRGFGVDTDAPWEGGNIWEPDPFGSGAQPRARIEDGVATIELLSDNSGMYQYLKADSDDEPDAGPWGPWGGVVTFTVKWKVNPLGTLADTDPNQLEFGIFASDYLPVLRHHLGDDFPWAYGGVNEQGIVLQSGGLVSSFVEKAIVADTWYITKWEIGATTLSGKFWEDGDPEPTAWDVQMDKDIQEVLAGQFSWFYILFEGNEGMKLFVEYVDAQLSGGDPGTVVGRHIIGYGDGTTVTFSVGQPYTPGSLAVWVDNQPVVPSSTDAAAGTFTLPQAPYGDPAEPSGAAIVEASYEAA